MEKGSTIVESPARSSINSMVFLSVQTVSESMNNGTFMIFTSTPTLQNVPSIFVDKQSGKDFDRPRYSRGAIGWNICAVCRKSAASCSKGEDRLGVGAKHIRTFHCRVVGRANSIRIDWRYSKGVIPSNRLNILEK